MRRRWFRAAPRQRRQAARASADSRAAAAGLERANHWIAVHLLPALGILALALVLVFGGIVLFGRDFKVSSVQVVGADLLDTQAIRRSANVAGRSIVGVSPARVEARLRAEYIVIAQVNVSRELPNKVIIRLQEQPARWAWESAGRYWWLRADGTVIGEMPDAGKLPVVHDIYRTTSAPGAYIAGVPWELAEAMLQALPVIPSFDYSISEGLIVYVTEKAWPVYLGTRGNAQFKAEILRELVIQLNAQQAGVAYIDLRNEAKPVYKKLA